MSSQSALQRSIGLWGATGIGVGAIVGGGVLALAGVAFATTGPSAIIAFALNGAIAFLTALSFAELAAAFPASGGAYTFAKKILSAEAAFMVGWVVWLASIVAAVLYALGFASYAGFAAAELLQAAGLSAAWLEGRAVMAGVAILATAAYAVSLSRKAAGGGQWATVGKVIVFVGLIAGGLWALGREPATALSGKLTPFFPGGGTGLLQAMGYTFIALQGFDLIAAVGGEVRDPRRTIPRAMFFSLGAALAIYLPFLFIIATVGVGPGESIVARSAADPATVVAVAARNYLGGFGFWLVIVAAVLSMLSALHANLMAASRVARSMAVDRSLPHALGRLDESRGTPLLAVLATALLVVVVILVVPDVAVAGAVSSLIFLISFTLAHGIVVVARQRGGIPEDSFRTPWYPLAPVAGGLLCLGLAFFQGIAVPVAGLLALLWLTIGFSLYFFLFARRAGVVDASAEGLDPELVRLRGRAPLVLVPIAKPASAAALTEVANALAPPRAGRVLLLSVLQPPGTWERGDFGQQLSDVQEILEQTMMRSLDAGSTPEWLSTVSPDAWSEIARVARIHRCESLLLGLGALSRETMSTRVEQLVGAVQSDVVILRSPPGWRLTGVRSVLVPVGGRRDQSRLRARLMATLCRTGDPRITYLRILPPGISPGDRREAQRGLVELAQDEVPRHATVELVTSADPTGELVRQAAANDLMILGLRRRSRRQRMYGELTLRLASETAGPLLLISRR